MRGPTARKSASAARGTSAVIVSDRCAPDEPSVALMRMGVVYCDADEIPISGSLVTLYQGEPTTHVSGMPSPRPRGVRKPAAFERPLFSASRPARPASVAPVPDTSA